MSALAESPGRPKSYDSNVKDLEDLLSKAKSARGRFESTWYMNVAYYGGRQWLFWARGRLFEPRLERWRLTVTDNRIIGIVRTEVAKMTKQRPVFVATPSTGDESDVSAAELAERILRDKWRSLGLQRKQRSALTWSRVCGAGFWKVYWDSSAGKTAQVLVGPDGKPMMGQDGRPMTADAIPPQLLEAATQQGAQLKEIAQGDVAIEVRSPFEMFIDPLAEEGGLDTAEWVIEQCVRSQDYVKRRYGIELPADAEAIAGIAESRLAPGVEGSGGQVYKGVKVSEYWARPSSKFPKGKRCVWAGSKILEEDTNPTDVMPYVMFSGITVPGRFWPTSIVEQLRGPQDDLNKTRSQIRENSLRIGNPMLLKSRLANVEYSGVPGEEVLYDDTLPNSVPSYLSAPELPAYLIQEQDRIEHSFQEISGQHEVTSAQVPAGVTAASAIQLLQEQDDTRLGPDIVDMETALAEAGTKALTLIARYYSDQRTVKLAGQDGDWDIFEFKGSMLGENTHVDVQAGSGLPQSKAAKQAAMQDSLKMMAQLGVPVTMRDLSRYFKDMDVGGFERLIEQFSVDEMQINRENRLMAQQGQALPINSFDDDQTHVEGHTNYQKTNRYATLDPQAQMLIEQHVQLHRTRIAQAQQAAAEQAAMQAAQAAAASAHGVAAAEAPFQPPPASATKS